jgi:hypothetical protein
MLLVLGVSVCIILCCVYKVKKMSTGTAITVSMEQTQASQEETNLYIGPHIYEDPEQCIQEYRLDSMVRKLSEVEESNHTNRTTRTSSAANGNSVRCHLNGTGYATLEVGSRTDYASSTDLQSQPEEAAPYERPWNTSQKSHYEYERKQSGPVDTTLTVQDYEAPVVLNEEARDSGTYSPNSAEGSPEAKKELDPTVYI